MKNTAGPEPKDRLCFQSIVFLQEFRGVFQEGLHCEHLFVVSGSRPTHMEGETLPWYRVSNQYYQPFCISRFKFRVPL